MQKEKEEERGRLSSQYLNDVFTWNMRGNERDAILNCLLLFLLQVSFNKMLFVDKHRPKSLNELHYHDGLSERLTKLVRTTSLSLYTQNGSTDVLYFDKRLLTMTFLIYSSLVQAELAKRLE